MVDRSVGEKGKTAGDIVAGAGAPAQEARQTGDAGGGGERGEARDRGKTPRKVTARQVAKRVYTESGVRGFYRGFGVSVLQFAPTSAVSTHAVHRRGSSILGVAAIRRNGILIRCGGRYEWFAISHCSSSGRGCITVRRALRRVVL